MKGPRIPTCVLLLLARAAINIRVLQLKQGATDAFTARRAWVGYSIAAISMAVSAAWPQWDAMCSDAVDAILDAILDAELCD
jgi:hypothetical protein